MSGDYLNSPYENNDHYDDIALSLRDEILLGHPSTSLGELWDTYGEKYGSARMIIYNIGKFFIPFSDDGKISNDYNRFSAFLAGATLAMRLVEETYVRQDMDPKDIFDDWESGKGPRVIDETKLIDMSNAERYEAQSNAIMAQGHKYLAMLPEGYSRLIDEVAGKHDGLNDTANIFKAAFGYVVGEAGRDAYEPRRLDDREQEGPFSVSTEDDSWLNDFMDRCYDVVAGETVDISIELNRIQRLFESNAFSRTDLEPGAVSLINDTITHEMNNDPTLKRVHIPTGTKLQLKNATYIVIIPERDVETGPKDDVDLEWVESGDTLEGDFEHLLSISVHPPGEIPVEEWLKTQETVYGPAIVLRNPVRRGKDESLIEEYEGKALIISLDHPSLRASYQVA